LKKLADDSIAYLNTRNCITDGYDLPGSVRKRYDAHSITDRIRATPNHNVASIDRRCSNSNDVIVGTGISNFCFALKFEAKFRSVFDQLIAILGIF
jgi:hypothetical protein